MLSGGIGDLISAVTSRWSSPQSSTTAYKSSLPGSSPPPPGPSHAFGLVDSGQNNNLRLSSSLQDFSTYHRLDPEEGDRGLVNAAAHFKHPPSLRRENAGSSFSKAKTLSGGSPTWRSKKWTRSLALFLGLMLFGFLIFTVSTYIYSWWFQGMPRYYVVLDCGSTGTRVYVYQAFLNREKQGTLPFHIKSYTEGLRKKPNSQSGRAYDRMETEPGLDKLVHNVSGLKTAIKPLLRWAEKQIPKRSHKSTSLYLYATAGVRRLPSADSKWILDNAWSILQRSPFMCRREWIKIISGMEEAYYGWIALNHRTEVLGVTPRKPTYGALDLGGSSLQVTFESKELNDSTLKLRIGDANYQLSAYSLPGYGLNDAFGRSVVQLMRKMPEISNADLTKKKLKLNHPCLQSGYQEDYICSQCANALRAGGNSGKGGDLRIKVQLVGAPNWEECSAVAKVAVNFSEWSNGTSGMDCDVQPCALPDHFPRPYGQFFAMSGFYVVYRFFNLTSEATLDDVLEKGREFCEKPWEVARTSVAPQPFIEQYCFRAPYVVSLLREGLHITDKQVLIGSGSITWTLGVALLEAGNEFSTRMGLNGYEILHVKMNMKILTVLLLLSLILLLCALSCVRNWIPRFFWRSYLPLFRHNSVSSASVLGIPSAFRFRIWSPIISGDGRTKMPLSPTIVGSQERAFGLELELGASTGSQRMESPLYPPPTSTVLRSHSSNNVGQMQYDSGSVGSFWSPHRSQMRLQSRRSQSREDLNSSLAEAHMVKV